MVLRGCCPADCPETAEYTFNNINLSGVGPVDSSSNYTVNFRGVASANSMLTVTLDNVNHNALLTVDVAAIANAFRAANTTQTGILETATDAEAVAKAATDKILTPSNLAALGSSTTFSGLIEIATQAEVVTGAAVNLAVAPDTLKGMVFPSFATGVTTTVPASSFPTIDIGTAAFIQFTSDNTGGFGFNQINFTFSAGYLDFTNVGVAIAGVPLNNALLGTKLGVVADYDLADFASLNATETGYTSFANASILKTLDVNTCTTIDLGNVLNTLISTLKAVKLPAT